MSNTHRAPRTGPTFPAPVRRWAYGIAATVAPLATAYGLVTDQQAVLWLNLAGADLFIMAVGKTPTRSGAAQHEQ